MLPNSQCRLVDGTDGAYCVGPDSTIWTRWFGKHLQPEGSWRVLNPWVGKKGYLYVTFCPPSGKRFKKPLAHVVLEAFVGPRPQGMEACHDPDRTPTNNAIFNLRWDTRTANEHDKIRHGTDNSGSRNGMAKLSDEQVSEIISARRNGEGAESVAARYDVTKWAIYKIMSGLRRRKKTDIKASWPACSEWNPEAAQ